MKNYYEILGIEAGANREQIEAAYFRKAEKFLLEHDAADRERLLAVQEAYAVLSDPSRRQAYHRAVKQKRLQEESEKAPARPLKRTASVEPLIPAKKPADLGEISLSESFHTFRPSYQEVFDRLWSNITELTRPKAEKIESLDVEIVLSLEEAMRGGEAKIMVPGRVPCSVCRGLKTVGPFPCFRCGGGGTLTGEYPLWVRFPAGMSSAYTVQVAMDHIGIHNFYLTVHFRIDEKGNP
jgi:DnaJ-class molecular chaperone